MNREFLKEKIDKYRKKISLLKGGGVEDYFPAFYSPDISSYFITYVLPLINNEFVPYKDKIILSLLGSLFININSSNDYYNMKFTLQYLNRFNNICVIDFENQVPRNRSDPNIRYDREYVSALLQEAYDNPDKFYIVCCKNLPDILNISDLLIEISNEIDDKIDITNIIFIDIGVSDTTGKRKYGGGFDDFIFWLLCIAIFNLYDNQLIAPSNNLQKLICVTNDLQRWYDSKGNFTSTHTFIPPDITLYHHDIIRSPQIKNLYFEMFNLRYTIFNTYMYKNTNIILDIIHNNFLNSIIENMIGNNPINNKYIASLSGLNTMPHNNDRSNEHFISGIDLAQLCIISQPIQPMGINMNIFSMIDVNYDNFNFNGYKLTIFKTKNCTNFFDIMIAYIKFIQNIYNSRCNILDNTDC